MPKNSLSYAEEISASTFINSLENQHRHHHSISNNLHYLESKNYQIFSNVKYNHQIPNGHSNVPNFREWKIDPTSYKGGCREPMSSKGGKPNPTNSMGETNCTTNPCTRKNSTTPTNIMSLSILLEYQLMLCHH